MSQVMPKTAMRCVTLAQLKAEAKAAYDALWSAARQNGRDVKLYLHWTAGRYGQFWDDYHIQIDADGALYMPKTASLSTLLAATYRRNSGSVAIALLGCYGAATDGELGANPPTAAQIESMARAVAVLADALDLTIDAARMLTHGEAADNADGIDPGYEANGYPQGMYGPQHSVERRDLEYLGTEESPRYNPQATDGSRGGDVLRGKAAWYRRMYPGAVEQYF